MATEPIETVSVRLVADGSELMEGVEEAVEVVEKAGEAAGRAFVEGMSAEQFEEMRDAIADFAEALDVSFSEAAESMAQMAVEGGATREELLAVASAMDESADLSERAQQAIEAINESIEFLGSDAGPQARKEFEQMVKMLGNLEEVTKEDVALLELMADEMGKGAEQFNLAEAQVRKVVEAFRDMGIEIPNALQRNRIRDYVRQLIRMKDQFSDVKKEADNFTDAIIEQAKGGQGLRGVITNLAGGFDVLGLNLGKLIGGMAAGTAAVVVLKNVIGGMIRSIKEGIDTATGFAEANRDMVLAIRVNSVAGDENTRTFAEWSETAERVAELGNTSMKVGIETVTIALRELGAGTELSDDEINKIIVTGSKFAELYGITLPQGINQATRFINEGLAESLRGLGLDLDKTAQNQKTFELGLGTSIDKLDESTQEFVRYVLLLEEMEKRTEGAGEQVLTFADRMDDLARRAETTSNELGTIFLPFVEFFEKAKVTISEIWTDIMRFLVELGIVAAADVSAAFLSIIATMQFVGDQIKEGVVPSLKEVGQVLSQTFLQARAELIEVGLEKISGDMDEMERAAQAAGGATGELADEMDNLADEVAKFIEEAQKFDEGMARIQRRLEDALEDISTQFTARRAKAETDLQRDLRDIDRDAAIDRLETIRDFQIDEIRLREDHAKDIRQLEERFLLDLEDAVRDRDARGVLQLQRRFNLEKKRREEDFGLRQKRLREDFQFELQEIERQRVLRRQARILAFNEEMMDLAVQEQARIDAARLRADRAQRELLASIRARLLALEQAASDELTIETEKLDALVNALIAVYGPDGPWMLWHQEAIKTAQGGAEGVITAQHAIVRELAKTEARVQNHLRFMIAVAQQSATLRNAIIAGGGGERRFRQGTFGERTGFQRGGTFFATAPATLDVGEGRPERVDITPLSASTGAPSAGFGGRGRERVQIDLNVEASEQLAVEIVDQTMTEVADVFVSVSQRGFQGGRGA